MTVTWRGQRPRRMINPGSIAMTTTAAEYATFAAAVAADFATSHIPHPWDATVDFDRASDLDRALRLAGAQDGTTMVAIVRADGPTCEVGELHFAPDPAPEAQGSDWLVQGDTVAELVEQLQALLAS